MTYNGWRRALDQSEYRPMTYNGWRNYETWNANLWLTNEPGTAELIAECGERGHAYDAGHALRDAFEEAFAPDLPAGPASDAWTAYLGEVSWPDIIDSWRGDASYCDRCSRWFDGDECPDPDHDWDLES